HARAGGFQQIETDEGILAAADADEGFFTELWRGRLRGGGAGFERQAAEALEGVAGEEVAEPAFIDVEDEGAVGFGERQGGGVEVEGGEELVIAGAQHSGGQVEQVREGRAGGGASERGEADSLDELVTAQSIGEARRCGGRVERRGKNL